MFKQGQQVELRKDWKSLPETARSAFTHQLKGLPEGTTFTVLYMSGPVRESWLHLKWVGADGMTYRNSYEPTHFATVITQTAEELVDENISLKEQIGRLEKQAADLQARIERKKEFYLTNTASIKANLPDNVLKYAEYM